MYQQYFGLREKPFSIAVNPRYLFMSNWHRDALAHLLYGVESGAGFILLTGEVGTGKTTINRCLLEQLPDDTDVAIILNPALSAAELLATVCDELHVGYNGENPSLKDLTDALHGFLLENHKAGRKTVLMIDEAQHLDFEVLEQVRLLTNLETHTQKLLQIILIGQPELSDKLRRPELRQLNQRVSARYELRPLDRSETRSYIRHRLQVAGLAAGNELFPDHIVRGIHKHAQGIPRVINVLCDRILLGAYGQNKSRADRALLRDAVQEVKGSEPVGYRPVLAVAGMLLAVGIAWWGYDSLKPATPQIQPVAEQPPPPSAVPSPSAADAVDNLDNVDDLRRGLLSPVAGFAALWRQFSQEQPPLGGCDALPTRGIHCRKGSDGTWEEMSALDRPVLLELVSPERNAFAVVLLGQESDQVVITEGTTRLVAERAAIGRQWTGEYQFLWRPPSSYREPVSLGDRGQVVAEIARWFARLDGQAEPLASETFNPALQQRVRLFQKARGLKDDGVVGDRTLIALESALGWRAGGEYFD